MVRYIHLLPVALLISVAHASCYAGCMFRFCTYATAEFAVGDEPGRPFSGTLCTAAGSGKRLGKVHAFGEARLIEGNGDPTPISLWRPAGLQQPFSPYWFKSFDFLGTPFSGVTHEHLHQNQRSYLKERCWALPLAAYQLLNNMGNVTANINSNRPLVDCVSLKTFTF